MALASIKQTFSQPTVYTLYLAYAGYYLPRKADSVIKASLLQQGFSVEQIALSDTLYLFTYTVSMLFSGTFGSRIAPNKLLSGSLVALCIIAFLKSLQLSPFSFTVLQILHALCQSTGWPTCIRVLSGWIVKDRGFLMGVWTTCQSIGGVFGAVFASYLLSNVSFGFAYLGHIPILLVISLLCYRNVFENPSIGHSTSFKVDKEKQIPLNPASDAQKSPPSFARLLCAPAIFSVSLAYFFLKFLRYALLMWLPFYFEEALSFAPDVAGYASSAFELGGLIGTPLIGYVSDNVMKGDLTKTASYFMFGGTMALIWCISVAKLGVFLNWLSMLVVGILVIGPDSVMSGTIISDLVIESGFSYEAVGKVAGLVNSIGSFGAIFQSATTAYISERYGWATLFSCLVFCASISSSVLAFAVFTRSKKL